MQNKQNGNTKQGPGFIKVSRNNEVAELMRFHPAFMLLLQIALRAKRSSDGFNPHGLRIGQAAIGDFRSIGLSEQNYRTAKQQLEKWGFASFTGTKKGTIATLLNTRIFNINPDTDPSNEPANDQLSEGNEAEANGLLNALTPAETTPLATTKKKLRTQVPKNSEAIAECTHHLRDAVVFEDEERAPSVQHAWRNAYNQDELRIIDLYHEMCVPRGWLSVNKDSPQLHDALNTFQGEESEWLENAFREAADERDAGGSSYNSPKGNKLLRILWANY